MSFNNNCNICNSLKKSNFKIFSRFPVCLKVCQICYLISSDKNEKKKIDEVTSLKKFNEIKKFQYSSEKINNEIIFIKKIFNILNIEKRKDLKILDYGCGYGSLLEGLDRENLNGYGFDINQFFYSNLKDKYKMFNDTNDILNSHLKFDLIILRKVLNLSPNINKDYEFLKKVLNNNGHIVILDQVQEFNKYMYDNLYFRKKNNTYLLTLESLVKLGKFFNLIPIFQKNRFGDILLIFKNINENKKKEVKVNSIFLYSIKIKLYIFFGLFFFIINFIMTFCKNFFKKIFIR